MLSGETSVGKYPAQAVRQMDTILAKAEKYIVHHDLEVYDLDQPERRAPLEAIGHSCFTSAEELQKSGRDAKILVITDSGFTARVISKYR